MKTKIIVIEGCDGSGKTTLTKNLKKYIDENIEDYSADVIAYPHKGYFGYEKIREILSGKIKVPPDISQSLFLMNMIDSFENYVNPYFDTNGKILIMDRSIISTIIYNKVENGNILESIVKYLYKEEKYLHAIDINIINREYCNLHGNLDKIFLICPPLEIITQHATNRELENKNIINNDTKKSVIEQYKHYLDIYHSLKKFNNNNIYLCNNWNYALSEKENYLNIQNNIIENIFQ